jgi:hypothetical protein
LEKKKMDSDSLTSSNTTQSTAPTLDFEAFDSATDEDIEQILREAEFKNSNKTQLNMPQDEISDWVSETLFSQPSFFSPTSPPKAATVGISSSASNQVVPEQENVINLKHSQSDLNKKQSFAQTIVEKFSKKSHLSTTYPMDRKNIILCFKSEESYHSEGRLPHQLMVAFDSNWNLSIYNGPEFHKMLSLVETGNVFVFSDVSGNIQVSLSFLPDPKTNDFATGYWIEKDPKTKTTIFSNLFTLQGMPATQSALLLEVMKT